MYAYEWLDMTAMVAIKTQLNEVINIMNHYYLRPWNYVPCISTCW